VKYRTLSAMVARMAETHVWRGPRMILKWHPGMQNVTQLARLKFYGR
jgi:hypothetical protein